MSIFPTVEVDGRLITFAAVPDSPDPFVKSLLEGVFPGDRVSELWRHLVKPGQQVIDVGAHIGTYTLPAAAAGANVIAVEGSSANAELLLSAVRANALANVRVRQAVAAAEPGKLAFTAHGPWGHVALSGEETSKEVQAVTIDELVREQGWDHVDLIKIDVEGSELQALAGLRETLASADAPALLIESNAHMLREYGYSPQHLVAGVQEHGYRCHLVDSVGPPGRLVPVSASDIQPELVADYLAIKEVPANLEPWWIDAPFDRAEVAERVLTTCRDDSPVARLYGQRLLEAGPAWLRESREAQTEKR